MAENGAPEPAELADHPGRPRGRDELDPELIRLPRPRARIGWLLAASVMVFCAYFMVRLRSDLAFSRQGDAPERLASVAALREAEPNRFVEVEAVPDRAFLLWVFASEATDGHRLSPVLGAGDGAWLMLPGSHWSTAPAYDEVYRGRVRRLGDLPFHDDLREHLAAMKVPRVIALDRVASEVGDGDGHVIDVAGEEVSVRADTPVSVTERVAGRALLTAVATGDVRDEKAVRGALEAAGVLLPGAPAIPAGTDAWSFEIDAPAGVDAVNQRLVAAKLLGARAAPLDRVHQAAWADLSWSAERDRLLLAGPPTVAIPASSLTAVAVHAPRSAPADARVLVTTERPEQYWYVLPLYVVFGGFILLFGWALVRTVRADLAAAAEARERNDKESTGS